MCPLVHAGICTSLHWSIRCHKSSSIYDEENKALPYETVTCFTFITELGHSDSLLTSATQKFPSRKWNVGREAEEFKLYQYPDLELVVGDNGM